MAKSSKPHPPLQTDAVSDCEFAGAAAHSHANAAGKAGATPKAKSDHHKVNPGEDDEMSVFGYVPCRRRLSLAVACVVLTGGLLALVFYWKKVWFLKMTHVPSSLALARKVLLKDAWSQYFVQTVSLVKKDGSKMTKREEALFYSQSLECDSETHLMSGVDGASAPRSSGGTPTRAGGSPPRLGAFVHRFFVNKKIKYIWAAEAASFAKLVGLEKDCGMKSLHLSRGLSQGEADARQVLYGSNKIVIRVEAWGSLLLREAINPFYIFQSFSCALWYADEYEFYASCILVISLVSLGVETYAIRNMQKRLRERVNVNGTVRVSRSRNAISGEMVFEDIGLETVVPGDVLEIPRRGCELFADAVLISGNCIVNEAMLTGESAPVTKTPLPTTTGVSYSIGEHSRHTLFCGTEVVQTRYYGNQKVLAVVVRTGFATSKGELVRSILYPKPVDFGRFHKDAAAFILFLGGVASIGFIFTVVVMVQRHWPISKIVLRSLDLITIVVPPALPAAMTVGIIHAQSRLKKQNIFCISPKLINVCGSLNTVCFDKTGTLTEDGLDLRSVHPADPVGRIFLAAVGMARGVIPLPAASPILAAMATCHSLTVIDDELVGDPLDIRMFEGTGWSLEEPEMEDTAKFDVLMPTVVKSPDEEGEIGILRQFPFSSSLQRMSVITKTIARDGPKPGFHLYCKGSPEMIVSLSTPSSVPSAFQDVLTEYTQQGFRVLALAHRPLAKLNYVKAQRVQREALETNLTFLGLLILENRLKPASTPAMKALKEARIRPVMVTGDNMLTALSVARECGMVQPDEDCLIVNAFKAMDGSVDVEYLVGTSPDESMALRMAETLPDVVDVLTAEAGIVRSTTNRNFHFALTGKSFSLIRQHLPDTLKRLVVRGTVFARMAPDQKQQLVESLQELGYYVGMCGDGANDCGALKTAHAGISLSDTEASIASPFTSKVADISCVPTTIREGRAALVTSFGIFKYMAAYSLIQFVTVLILYWIESNLTDIEFLYIDLYLLTVLSIFYGHTPAYSSLAPKPPTSSLLSLRPIGSLLAQVSLSIAFQTYAFYDVQRQPWFVPFVPNHDNDYYWSYENTVLFYVSVFQYITAAIAFSKGAPYRKTIFSNYLFLIALLLLTGTSIWILIYPPVVVAGWIELRWFPEISYSLKIFGLVGLNFFLALLCEMFIVDSNWWMTLFAPGDGDECLPARFSANQQCQYRSIEREIHNEPSWPPISRSSTHADFAIIQESGIGGGRGSDGRGSSSCSGGGSSAAPTQRHSRSKRLDSEVSIQSDAFSDLGSSPPPSPPTEFHNHAFYLLDEQDSATPICAIPSRDSVAVSKDDAYITSGHKTSPLQYHSLPATPTILSTMQRQVAPRLPPPQATLTLSTQATLLAPPTPISPPQAPPTSIPPLPAPPSFSPRRPSDHRNPRRKSEADETKDLLE